MDNAGYTIQRANEEQFESAGSLMVLVYSQLEGFPKPYEQPAYYDMLANVGRLTANPGTEILIAVNTENVISGAVVYFNDIQYYGSGGTATREKNAAGFRLLAVDPAARGAGLGRMLTLACVNKAKENGHRQIIIHTTNAMQTAWRLYEKIGFKRSPDLDFMQGNLEVFGFRLRW